MVSFDVKALFTNVPIDGAMTAVSRVLHNVDEESLPVPKEDFIKLISLCVSFNKFKFDSKEYEQISGLAMGSPLSAVLACLYMEVMEEDHYRRILGDGGTWMRYVDDVLTFVPQETDLPRLLQELNDVNAAIQFTIEEETNGQLPFLDTLIMKSGEGLKFTVYRKPTNKNDMIHYFSAHDNRVKSGTVLGFFLRAFRICSNDLLQGEINFIFETFTKLKYPRAELIVLRKTAERIMSRANREDDRSPPERTKTLVIVPNTPLSKPMQAVLSSSITTVSTGGRKLGDILKQKKDNEKNENSVVYKVPCGRCPRAYYGETGRGIRTRVREHRADLRYHRSSSAFVAHAEEEGHLPDWTGAAVVGQNLSKTQRRIVEAAFIATEMTINTSPGFFRLATAAANLVKKEASHIFQKED